MKTTILLAAILLTGCSGVKLNAEYSALLDRTAALSRSTADAALAGQLTAEQQTQALVKQADTWDKFRDARDGKAGN